MTYFVIAARIVSAMALILLLTLKTGRRNIGELPVYDFLSIIVIGSVIGADIAEPTIPHLPTMFAVVLIVALQYLVSYILINNKKLARKITFGPTVIIQNGQFIKENMKRLKYSVENVLMALREKDVFDLNEVEYAIIESSGNVSVLKKTRFRAATPSDFQLSPDAKSLPIPLIIDGKLVERNLIQLNRDKAWFFAQLEQHGIREVHEVFYADCDLQGKVYVSRLSSENGENKVPSL